MSQGRSRGKAKGVEEFRPYITRALPVGAQIICADNTGAKILEVQGTQAGILEAMPKQHMKEIGRQMKLAGATATMHGPIVEASGISNQGWSEGDRLKAEKQLTSALVRGNELDPDGNVSVTTHTTAGLPEM